MTGWAAAVLDFWFGVDPDRWWRADAEFDRQIAKRFLDLWEDKRRLPADAFLGSQDEALAAVLLFDQLPRNMFRGHADQFSTDHLARAVARSAVDRGLDEALPPARRQFLYMPFQHSEAIDDQRRSLASFTALGEPDQMRFARLHHDVIARFGRFPHRNAMLGRKPTRAERNAGEVVPW